MARTKLSDTDVQSHLASVPGWTLENGELTRTLELKSFPAAILFVSAVGHLAEAADHHPDFVIKYRKVTLSLVTHDAGGITQNDFNLAREINEIAPKS